MTKVLVVGGGRMGGALIGGLLRAGWVQPSDVAVAEVHEGRRHELTHRYGDVLVSDRVVPANSAVLAVKPQDAEAAARALAAVAPPRVVSIVAGVPLARLEEWLGPETAVLRAMPNLPALIGNGASVIAGGRAATEDDFAWAEAVFSSVGVVARVPEQLLDAVTGLSGSGPGYVFLLVEALIDAGVAEGLDREVSGLLVVQTLLGAARMLAETGEPAAALREAVTSPGGTTAAGLGVLEERGFREALGEAVAAATARSKELGGSRSENRP